MCWRKSRFSGCWWNWRTFRTRGLRTDCFWFESFPFDMRLDHWPSICHGEPSRCVRLSSRGCVRNRIRRRLRWWFREKNDRGWFREAASVWSGFREKRGEFRKRASCAVGCALEINGYALEDGLDGEGRMDGRMMDSTSTIRSRIQCWEIVSLATKRELRQLGIFNDSAIAFMVKIFLFKSVGWMWNWFDYGRE